MSRLRTAIPPLHVTHVVAPSRVGGLERVVHMLAAGHRARGHVVRAILCVAPDERDLPLADWLRAADVAVDLVRVPGRAYAAERRAVARHLAAHGAQVAHTHGYRPDLLHGAFPPRGVATASTVHGFTGGSRRNRLNEWLQERALRRLDAVVAVSGPIVDRLRDAGVSAARLHCRPNAFVAPTRALDRAAARARLGLPMDAFVVGWVGRLSHEKGPDHLPAIAARLPEGALLAVLGAGPLTDLVRGEAERLGVADRVRLLGVRLDAPELMAAFDAYLLTSRTEGTPIALLEAMAAARPVVATRVGGVPDVLADDCGWLVPADDTAAMADALAAVHADPAAARERGARAQERVGLAFAPDPWLDWYEQLYARLVRGTAPVALPAPAPSAALGRHAS